MYVTIYQPDTKSNLNPNPISTTKEHTVVSIQSNKYSNTHQDKFIRDILFQYLYYFRL